MLQKKRGKGQVRQDLTQGQSRPGMLTSGEDVVEDCAFARSNDMSVLPNLTLWRKTQRRDMALHDNQH